MESEESKKQADKKSNTQSEGQKPPKQWGQVIRDTLHVLSSKGWLQEFGAGLVFLLAGPIVGAAMNNPKVGIYGLALGLTLVIWIVAYIAAQQTQQPTNTAPPALVEAPPSPKGAAPQSSPAPPPPKTLHEYFLSDFTHILNVGERRDLTLKSGETVHVETRLHMDFDAKATFISIYIPNTHWTPQICSYIAREGHKQTLKLTEGVGVEELSPGDKRGVSTKELKFTGSVFIYHEFPIFDADIDLLRPEFQKSGLSPQFRGPDYAVARNNPAPAPPSIPSPTPTAK